MASLLILLGIELLYHYDSWSRQLALSLTNVLGGGGFAVLWKVLRRKGIELHWLSAIFIAAAIWFDAMGNFLFLYRDLLWWDRVSHLVGSIAPAFVISTILLQLRTAGRIVSPSWWMNFSALASAMLLSVLYEISEYLGDLWLPTHRVTDVFDTPDDLLWNLIGAAIGIFVSRVIYSQTHRKNTFDRIGKNSYSKSL